MSQFKVREDFANQKEYENYKRKLFLDQSSLIKLQNVTLIKYQTMITLRLSSVGIHSSGTPEIEELVRFSKIVFYNKRLKQSWLRKVNYQIFSLVGYDDHAFLTQEIIRESLRLEQEAFLLFDDLYVTYLIQEFGIEHDLSNENEVAEAYGQAIISKDRESQKLLSKKFIQQLVKQEQNAIRYTDWYTLGGKSTS